MRANRPACIRAVCGVSDAPPCDGGKGERANAEQARYAAKTQSPTDFIYRAATEARPVCNLVAC